MAFSTREIAHLHASLTSGGDVEYLDTTKNFRIYRPKPPVQAPLSPIDQQVEAARVKTRMQKRIANAICTRCGYPNPRAPKLTCAACGVADTKHSANRRQRLYQQGKCMTCGLPNPRHPKRFCASCAEKANRSSRESQQRERQRRRTHG